MAHTFRFVDEDGRAIGNRANLDGYTFRDYFPGVDLGTATPEELAAAYLGVDCDGIAVSWTCGT